jgi:hypothetical protein
MIKLCTRVHPEFGERLAKGLGLSVNNAKLWRILNFNSFIKDFVKKLQ